MTDYKILGQEAPLANAEQNLYSVPSTKSAVVRAIDVTNTSSTADTFDIAIVEDGNIGTTYNNLYVTVGYNSNISLASTDAITWYSGIMPSINYWQPVAFGNGTFVSLAYGSAASATSTDGLTWTARTLPLSGVWNRNAVTYGNGTFVAIAYDTSNAIYSTNGATWTATTMPSSQKWRAVAYGNGTFVAISTDFGYGSAAAATSTDGVTWTARTLPSLSYWISIAFGGGIFVAISDSRQEAAYSTDGITWTSTTLAYSAGVAATSDIAHGNGSFVITSGYSGYQYSTDAITWNGSSFWPAGILGGGSTTFGNGIFVSVFRGYPGSRGFLTSTDGATWTQRTMPLSQERFDVQYGSGNFVWYPLTSNEDYLFKSHEILGNETITIKGGHTVDSDDQIRVKSTNGTSAFHAFGGEI